MKTINEKYLHARDEGLRGACRKHVDYAVAGPDAELLCAPHSHLWVQIKGEGDLYINGNRVEPERVYQSGVKDYYAEYIGQSNAGKFPAINSAKVSEGALFKFWAECAPNAYFR